MSSIPQSIRRLLLAVAFASVASTALAHGSTVGAIEIEHPYAAPSLAGARNGVAYLLRVRNTGTSPDRLLRASSPVAGRVEVHTMAVNPQGVMQMREVDGIAVAPKATVEMKPGMGYHFMLMDLKQPLKEGDTFAMTVVFEKAGSLDLKVVVQTPKSGGHAH